MVAVTIKDSLVACQAVLYSGITQFAYILILNCYVSQTTICNDRFQTLYSD